MKKVERNVANNGQIRIIGGQWRGRKLPVLNRDGLRPTTDRIRETVFNWLAADIYQARCLDCYAGSGALGLEALSRYASHATLLEHDWLAVQQLNKNQCLLKTMQCNIIQTNTLTWLAKQGTPFDIVFVDPPFRQAMAEKTCQLLAANGWLASNAIIYLECEIGQNPPITPDNWQLHRQKRVGQVACHLYRNQGYKKVKIDVA